MVWRVSQKCYTNWTDSGFAWYSYGVPSPDKASVVVLLRLSVSDISQQPKKPPFHWRQLHGAPLLSKTVTTATSIRLRVGGDVYSTFGWEMPPLLSQQPDLAHDSRSWIILSLVVCWCWKATWTGIALVILKLQESFLQPVLWCRAGPTIVISSSSVGAALTHQFKWWRHC